MLHDPSFGVDRPQSATRVTVLQGQVRVSADPLIEFSTVLGSCVATCLFDPEARVGGMNHFLLPEPPASCTPGTSDEHYGVYLMELLINEILRHGAAKRRMRAHIYGGANIRQGMTPIGSANAEFARNFLAREGIALARDDLGGTFARRVDFRPAQGWVRCRTVDFTPAQEAAIKRLPLATASMWTPYQESGNGTMTRQTRILTVDDSASMRALLKHSLGARGFAVCQAEDGVDALEWLERNEADVIVTDINMPRMDGFGLIARLRETPHHRDRPILVLSTEDCGEQKARARAAGATGWIAKPFDPDRLADAIRRVAH